MDSPVKHSSVDTLTPEGMTSQNLHMYSEEEPIFSEKDVNSVAPDITSPPQRHPALHEQLPDIGTIANNYSGPDGPSVTDNATFCVGLNVSKPSCSKNLETVIDHLNSQLDVLNTEIRDEINELSTISPQAPASPVRDIATKSSELRMDNINPGTQQVSGASDISQSETEITSQIIDRLFSEKPAPSPVDSSVNSPQGLTIEELEPISVAKPKRKAKRNASQKENSRRKKKGDQISTTSGGVSWKPRNSTEVSQPGETEFLSDLQRALTSNISKTTTPPKKCRSPRNSQKNPSVPMISLDEKAQKSSQPSAQEDPTMNSKLLTELQRLLTQNNIRSALQGDKKKMKCTRPSLDSPPYIRPPQAHDSSSMDGTRFTFDKPKMFPCQQCNKEFKTKQCLKRHISRHLGVKLHVCSYCNKRFNDKSNLKRHVVTHINLRKFVCDVCNQPFFRKEVMELHKRRIHTVHSDILKCRFKKCSFTCNVPYKLVDHIQTMHFQNYRYNCDKCRYKTQHNLNFLKHLRVHSGDRPYKCAKCGKAFKQRNALKKHSEIHLDRPHKCEICLKTFCLELALRIHYENNHGPRAAQKKLHEKKKREILRKYREQRSKKISFVNVMPTNL